MIRRLTASLLVLGAALPVAAQETLLLRQPSVSEKHIAFAYAGNIWVVDRAGGESRRLTSFQGGASNPRLSPDGATVAFTGSYGGNADVYVVPVGGGEPKRLTWHPGGDNVQGWTPDGKRVVFASGRQSHAPNPVPRFWTVSTEGGAEEPMAIPRAFQGMISPDGARIAYRMASSWDDERRNYRGGQNKPIWVVDLESYALDTIARPLNSKELDPVWVGNVVYFVSDRDGVQNVWSYDSKSKKLTQLTHVNDSLFSQLTLSAAEPFWYKSFDGQRVQVLIPGGTFHAARVIADEAWFLGASTEWPAVVPGNVELGSLEQLAARHPDIADDLRSIATTIPHAAPSPGDAR